MIIIMYKQVALVVAGFVICALLTFLIKSSSRDVLVHLNHVNFDVVTDSTLKYQPHPTPAPSSDWRLWYMQLSLTDKENEFYRYLRELQTHCHGMVRLGRITDGGWEVCLEPGFRPRPNCVVYSFGINNLWDFDDGAAHFGCEVHSFDPSMKRDDFKRGENINFHNLGLDGANGTNKKGWRMQTLGTIRNILGHTDKTIDILKMDIEFSEWAALEKAFQEGSLINVKQLMFEIHTSMMIAMKRPVNDEAYTYMYGVFKTLESLGFQLYWSTTNIQDRHISPVTGKTRFCCFEIYWINKNFRKR